VSEHHRLTPALERALDTVESQLDLGGYPHVTEGGRWLRSADGLWTGGFWIGLLWSAFEERGDERFRAAAAAERADLAADLRRLGVRHVVLSTAGDWLFSFARQLRTGARAS